MLDATTEKLRAAVKLRVRWNGAPITVGDALEHCRTEASFRSQLIERLAAGPFDACFWELPPLTRTSLARPFEFVLVDAPGLAAARPDPSAFRQHFGDSEDGVVAFDNLGRDATLVVPCPEAPVEVYVHLTAFLRGAPLAQRHALLRRTASEALARISHRPLWLSTAGMGVHWLHVRLDARPKYYRHGPYRSPGSEPPR